MKERKIKTIVKLFVIVCIVMLLLSINIAICQAAGGEIQGNPKINDTDDLKDLGEVIIGIVQWIGSAVAIIIVAVNGVKYMMSSVEEKAEYKKTIIYYIIGGVLVFSAVNILSIAYSLFK